MTILIKKYEGKSLSPYRCPAGTPTIGYGITRYPDGRPVTMDDEPITEDYAEALLNDYCIRNIYPIMSDIPYTLTARQQAALSSLIYNIGAQAFKKSNLFKAIKEKNLTEICKQWDWYTAGGKVLKGLVKRRVEELHYFIGDL